MVTTSGPWTVYTVFSLWSCELFSNTIWDKRACEYVLKDEAWQTGGIFWLVFQQVNLTAQIKTTSSTTESGHTWQHTQTFHKKTRTCIYTQLCHSLKNLSAQRACVRVSAEAFFLQHSLLKERDRLSVLFIVTQRAIKTASTTTTLLLFARLVSWN